MQLEGAAFDEWLLLRLMVFLIAIYRVTEMRRSGVKIGLC
jgi:hypothetical protein